MSTKDQGRINNIVSGSTKVYGIIGNPVIYSLSPMIHNTISEIMDIDSIYIPFPVDKGELADAIKGGHSLFIKGFNITHPFKEEVMKHLDYIDPLAQRIGAVNTLKYEDGGYSGYNTDADGLYRSLTGHNIIIDNKDVIVLGAGGAARATSMMAADKGARSIYILNRTLSNAKLLARDIKKYYNINVQALAMDKWQDIPKDSICFQTTSLGMVDSIDLAPIYDEEFYNNISVAIDLIYNPFETLFLKKAKRQGKYTINGLGMLLYQAIRAYEIWNDIEISDSKSELIYNLIEEEYTSI